MPVDTPPVRRSGSDAPDPSSSTRHVASATGLVSIMVLLSRGLGFVRDAILAAYYGQGAMTDAYRYGFRIPDLLWMLIAGGVMYAAYVPVITGYMTRKEDDEAWETFSIIATFLFCVLSVVIPVCWIFATPLLKHVLAPGLAETVTEVGRNGGVTVVHPLALAVQLTRIVLPAQYCFFIGSLMMGMLQSKKRFLIPTMGPVIYNLAIIFGGVVFHRQFGIAAFSWGALAGALIGNFLLQIWAIRGIGARFQPSLRLRHPGVRQCGKLALPVIFGISLPQVDSTVNGIVIAGVRGGMSILENTNRLMQLPLGIVGQALGIAILPTLSQQAAESDLRRFKETVSFGVRLSLYLTVPLALLLMVLARPIIAVVYQRGHYTPLQTSQAVPSLLCYALGIAAYSAQAVVARAFYARQDTLTPMLAGSFVTVFIFVPLNYALFHLMMDPANPWLSTRGPALATSLGATTNFLLNFFLLHRKVGGLNLKRIGISLARILLGGLALAAVAHGGAWGVETLLHPAHLESLLELLVGGGLGLAGYGVLTYRLGSEEARQVWEIVQSRLLRRRRANSSL